MPDVRPTARRSPCLGQPLAFTTHPREPEATGALPQRRHLTTWRPAHIPRSIRHRSFVFITAASSPNTTTRIQCRCRLAHLGSPSPAPAPQGHPVLVVQSPRPPHFRLRLSRMPALPFSWSSRVGPSPAPPPRSAHARETPGHSHCPASQHRRPPGSHRPISACVRSHGLPQPAPFPFGRPNPGVQWTRCARH